MEPKYLALVVLFMAVICWTSVSTSSDGDDEDEDELYEETVVLKTKMGSLRGRKELLIESGRSYYAFKGIRYAKAPIEARRFQVNHSFSDLMRFSSQ